MDEEQFQERLEYVLAHRGQIHLFGERTDGLEVCLIHNGEIRVPKGWRPKGNAVIDQFV